MLTLQGRLETEEKIEQNIIRKLDTMPEYIQNWYYNMRAQDITIKSCRDYLEKVINFLLYINSDLDKIVLNKISDGDLSKYFIEIQTTKKHDGCIVKTSDSYRNTVWFALNNFFNYQKATGKVKNNNMKLVKPKKNKAPEIKAKDLLSIDDFNKILQFIPGDSLSIQKRNKAILLLYMNTGMRKDALRQINISDIDFNTNELIVIDKGEKTHIYSLNSDTIIAINDWIMHRKYLLQGHLTDALFISYQGNRISGNAIYNMVTEATEVALGKKISPHKFRSGLVTILYEQTHDIEFVRKAIGHSNIATTQRYIVTDDTEKQKASEIMQQLLQK